MTAWAITAYFNPGRFRRRYENYQAFRRALALPLLTVEWSPEARFDLEHADADRLLRVSGGDLMWQKERLLNLAVSALPRDCGQVAWLDCDVLFADDGWVDDMKAELEQAAVVQLFSQVVHLPAVPGAPPLLVRDALARSASGLSGRATDPKGLPDAQEAFELERLAERPSSGHAWAARRELLDAHGLYDACICGAGDMATALAALGRSQAFLDEYPLNAAQRQHYRAWSARFADAVAGKVGCLTGTLHHLFHGRMADRQYRARMTRLADSGFDPARQLRLAAPGAWEWAAPDPALARFMADYFRDRREDG
jgi:hypothetical protein